MGIRPVCNRSDDLERRCRLAFGEGRLPAAHDGRSCPRRCGFCSPQWSWSDDYLRVDAAGATAGPVWDRARRASYDLCIALYHSRPPVGCGVGYSECDPPSGRGHRSRVVRFAHAGQPDRRPSECDRHLRRPTRNSRRCGFHCDPIRGKALKLKPAGMKPEAGWRHQHADANPGFSAPAKVRTESCLNPGLGAAMLRREKKRTVACACARRTGPARSGWGAVA